MMIVDPAPAPPTRQMPVEREVPARQALTRFVRNTSRPEDMETLRHNLIAARIVAGLNGIEAAERFGYANSTQLSQIESGARKVPSDWAFLRLASKTYGVSTDFLLGLSPHIEFDSKVTQQHALLRKTEAVIGSVAETFATALIRFASQEQLSRVEIERINSAAVRLEEAMAKLRERGFDDFPGGSVMLAAVDEIVQAAEPLVRKVKQYQTIDDYLAGMREGKIPVIQYLTERYDEKAVRDDVLQKEHRQ
ncbi:helix-turn-helix domain-containing protein [Pseudoduganella sp. R-32]|uniref:helix-turn-helix domain-containing protein n=1 Tax=Pseudoduganella sp. R-32 TaxID=3404061 RepID=UPI003CE9F371